MRRTSTLQFSGGSRVVHYGLLTLRQITLLSAAFYVVGIGIGLYLCATRGWISSGSAPAGALLSVFYTAPPLQLVHRGLGEIDVFLGFGPIMALGAYYVQAQEFDLEPLLASIPVGILIALVLYVNEVPDRPADAAAEARTAGAVLSGRDRQRVRVAVALTFALIVVFALAGWIVRPAIIALAAAPLALPVYRALKSSYDQPYALIAGDGKEHALHLATGVLLILGYVIALIADGVLDDPPAFLTEHRVHLGCPDHPRARHRNKCGLVPRSPRLHDLPHRKRVPGIVRTGRDLDPLLGGRVGSRRRSRTRCSESACAESTSCTSTAGPRKSSIRTRRSRRSRGASASSQSSTTTGTS